MTTGVSMEATATYVSQIQSDLDALNHNIEQGWGVERFLLGQAATTAMTQISRLGLQAESLAEGRVVPKPSRPVGMELGSDLSGVEKKLYTIGFTALSARASLPLEAPAEEAQIVQSGSLTALKSALALYRSLNMIGDRGEVQMLPIGSDEYRLLGVNPEVANVLWLLSDWPNSYVPYGTLAKFVGNRQPTRNPKAAKMRKVLHAIQAGGEESPVLGLDERMSSKYIFGDVAFAILQPEADPDDFRYAAVEGDYIHEAHALQEPIVTQRVPAVFSPQERRRATTRSSSSGPRSPRAPQAANPPQPVSSSLMSADRREARRLRRAAVQQRLQQDDSETE